MRMILQVYIICTEETRGQDDDGDGDNDKQQPGERETEHIEMVMGADMSSFPY